MNLLQNLERLYPLLLAATKSDPERAHRQVMKLLSSLEQAAAQPWATWARSQLEQAFVLEDPRLTQQVWGLKFGNPLGLAAGFDKNAEAPGIWSSFGFGFAELGAVTLQAQPGNPQPRLFRLPRDRAILNRLGANNLGAATIAAQLQQAWTRRPRSIPVGINLCKSKLAELDEAPEDYLGSFRALRPFADFFTVNVSSPNTPGLRALQATEQLEPILAALQAENQQKVPILIKIAPDLDWEALAQILQLAQTYDLAGIIATNTTTRRDNLKTYRLPATGKLLREEAGGISGLPLKARSTAIIRFIWQQTQGKLPIVGVGGD
ncbi:MAG: quinone-dependent dihydroorotate dehydrogenase, partial [Chloroflexaceae bacterium]|nr:quinone-dependent dihydroorotate dehydrogenase [Chloroflexaceae bacterium]